MLDRRTLISAAAAALALPRLALAAAPTERRFIFIILRGAMDGIGTVIPYADPAYAPARRQLAETATAPAKIDGLFALHPALAATAGLFAGKEALAIHAVASPYRERSHFDGQNILETGGVAAYVHKDGWLQRLLAAIAAPPAAIAVAPTVPPILRGDRPVASFAPSRLPDASDDLIARVSQLYEADPLLHPLWGEALAARALAGDAGKGRQQLPELARIAADFLASAEGPRIAVLEHDGWDTHAGQPARLANQLRQLDAALAALKLGLGNAWAQTVVVAATEFGRTVAANGTGGTDHGTASAAFVAGGAVAGGRVVADWPGLAPANLSDGRDLRPTTDLYAVLLGILAAHFTLDPALLAPALFPDHGGLRPVQGLLRTA
jgi:uncharacterized protein (DUF1501 family)